MLPTSFNPERSSHELQFKSGSISSYVLVFWKKSLDYNGLQHLTSLKELSIQYCPELQCIPEEGLPSSISYLEIGECPVVQRRCRRGEGEEWPKISRIPRIFIPPLESNDDVAFDPKDEHTVYFYLYSHRYRSSRIFSCNLQTKKADELLDTTAISQRSADEGVLCLHNVFQFAPQDWPTCSNELPPPTTAN